MPNHLSLPHLMIATGLVALAAWLGLASGNALGATYSLIVAVVMLSRAFDRPAERATVRVEVEP